MCGIILCSSTFTTFIRLATQGLYKKNSFWLTRLNISLSTHYQKSCRISLVYVDVSKNSWQTWCDFRITENSLRRTSINIYLLDSRHLLYQKWMFFNKNYVSQIIISKLFKRYLLSNYGLVYSMIFYIFSF